MDAVVFPGQGSQKPGMGEPWRASSSWSVVEQISTALGRDVADLLLNADGTTLQLTRNAQVASFALGLVILDAARHAGLTFGLAAGHSLGEYTALVAAGALDTDAAAVVVGERADAMQAAAEANPGTMAAVLGLEADAVAAACAQAPGGAWMANDNAPGQIVIAGTAEGVARAGAAAKEHGGKVLPLAVGGAFHTPLMAPAQERLVAALEAAPFGSAQIPVIANVDADAHVDAIEWAGLLGRQLCSPVRWRESVLSFGRQGATRVVELGPGGVLSGMVKRIDPALARLSISAPSDFEGLQ